MNNKIPESISKAEAQLREKDCFIKGDEWFGIQSLLPKDQWKGKRIGPEKYHVFADDSCGNEYLKNKHNVVFFWDHETDEVTEICDSIIEFLGSLEKTPEVELKPEQVISTWVNPDFKPEFD